MPFRDEILIERIDHGEFCHTTACAQANRPAEFTVTFGVLEDLLPTGRPAPPLWPDKWHRTYALCGTCWSGMRLAAIASRPRLTIRDTPSPRPRIYTAGETFEAG